jgi:hypothetical protein
MTHDADNSAAPRNVAEVVVSIQPSRLAEIYDTLSSMNRAFVGIVQCVQTLQKTGLFQSKAAKLFPSFAQELQAEFNQEFLEALHQLELDDWGRYGKARDKYEKHLRDPDDVFIHAEERKKQLAKRRKRTTKQKNPAK